MRFKLAIIALLSILTSIIVQAQENRSYTLVYWASPVSDATPQIAADFLADIENNLAQYNISTNIIQWPYSNIEKPADGDVTLYFYEHFNSERVIIGTEIRVEIYPPIVHTLSPILEEDRNINLTLPDSNAEEIVTGLILYTAGNVDDAHEILVKVQASDHEYPTLDFYLGNIALLNGDFDTAIAYFEDNIWNPIGGFYGTNLAWAYFQTDNREAAFDLINDSLELAEMGGDFNTTISLYKLRAQLYALAFDYDSAIADIDIAIELAEAHNISNEQLAELYTLRGEIIFLIYEWDRVLENFNTALDLNPDYAPAYFQRGVLYYTMARREDALADFRHYLEIAPDGIHAAEAQHYSESIQTELNALGG